MKAAKWEIKRTEQGEWYAHLVAPNGKIVCVTETFKRRRGALTAIGSIRKNAGATVFEVHE